MVKVCFTRIALRELDEALIYSTQHYPSSVVRLRDRINRTINRIRQWPESAQRIAGREQVRMVPLLPFPYKLFYEVSDEFVTILHIHHMSRRDPWEIQSR